MINEQGREAVETALSLWTLYSWLTEHGADAEAAISEGYAQIQSFRWTEQRSYEPAVAELLCSKVTRGKRSYDHILCNDMDAVYIRGMSGEELVNQLSEAFSFYGQWERSLLDAAADGTDLQQLLDVADPAFRRPIIIKSDGSWIYALSKGYPADVHPFWAWMADDGVHQKEDFASVAAVSTDPDFQSVFSQRFPSILRSPSYGGMILHANLFGPQRRVGEIIALENGRAFNLGEIHLINRFAEIVQRCINNHYEYYLSTADPNTVLQMLIEQRGNTDINIPGFGQTLELRADEALHLAVIEGKSQTDTPMLSVLREKLGRNPRCMAVCSIEQRVVCLLRGGISEKNKAFLRQQLPEGLFFCGISYEFCGLDRLPLRYRQACAALEIARESGRDVTDLYQSAGALIGRCCGQIGELALYLHPDIERLRQADQRQNTQYCHTLFCYLMAGGNYTDTAAWMGLHRNSLIYRMDKIRALMHSNPDDMENRQLLLSSFLVDGELLRPLAGN